MARRRRGGGLLGLFAFIIVVLLIVAYLQKHNFHIDLPDFGHTGKGSLGVPHAVFTQLTGRVF
jgi:hypothetical protein